VKGSGRGVPTFATVTKKEHDKTSSHAGGRCGRDSKQVPPPPNIMWNVLLHQPAQ
jgi:hypothetical protein